MILSSNKTQGWISEVVLNKSRQRVIPHPISSSNQQQALLQDKKA